MVRLIEPLLIRHITHNALCLTKASCVPHPKGIGRASQLSCADEVDVSVQIGRARITRPLLALTYANETALWGKYDTGLSSKYSIVRIKRTIAAKNIFCITTLSNCQTVSASVTKYLMLTRGRA